MSGPADRSLPLSDRSARIAAFLATGEGYREIRRAIADPGAGLTRKGDEDLTDWQTRAVMAALGRSAALDQQRPSEEDTDG